MNDDFRVRVRFGERRQAAVLGDRLERGELEHELARGATDRVVVSIDDRDVFLYAATRDQADAAATAVAGLAQREGWDAHVEVRRWHPVAEDWEDPDTPLPESDTQLAAEQAERIAQERAESAAWGFPEYEVRLELRSHRDTVALDEQLRAEGLRSLRRWHYLLIGAADEQQAQALADRLGAEAPPGTTVSVEASLRAIAHETPANPFAVLGGLGG